MYWWKRNLQKPLETNFWNSQLSIQNIIFYGTIFREIIYIYIYMSYVLHNIVFKFNIHYSCTLSNLLDVYII